MNRGVGLVASVAVMVLISLPCDARDPLPWEKQEPAATAKPEGKLPWEVEPDTSKASTPVKETEPAPDVIPWEKEPRQKDKLPAAKPAAKETPKASAPSPESLSELRRKAEAGDAESQHLLGSHYYDGKGVACDYDEAVKWWRAAEKQGYVKAKLSMGYCYRYGRGVEQDHEQAFARFMEASKSGDGNARNMVGVCYEQGKGVKQSDGKAFRNYTAAAQKGDKVAMYNLARCWEKGIGTSVNKQVAQLWYETACKKKYTKACASAERLKTEQDSTPDTSEAEQVIDDVFGVLEAIFSED